MDCELVGDEIEILLQIPFEEFEELVCPTPEDASQIEKLIQELLEEGENNV